MAHVSIVGGGIIGLLAARELRAAGLEVSVLDRGEIGREASWAGSGILSPLHPWRQPEAIHPLSLWSQQAYPDLAAALAAESGVDPQLLPSGLLLPDCPDADAARAWAARWRLPIETLDAAALHAAEPALAAAHGGILLPRVAQIRNPRLLRALRLSLQHAGVAFEEHCEVLGFAIRSTRVVGLDTRHGQRPVDQLLIAGGAWSGELLRGCGIDLPIAPVRGQILALQTPPGRVRHVVLAQDHYLVPRRDGLVLAGSTVEHVGFDRALPPTGASALRVAAARLLPELADAPQVAHWAGLRPGSADGVPYIGRHPRLENVVVSAGHYRSGLTLAPASAALVRALITGQRPPIDPAPYRLDRPTLA
ncbi:MAG: glycine oxidase ThiO [Pseudomonadota bacterium]